VRGQDGTKAGKDGEQELYGSRPYTTVRLLTRPHRPHQEAEAVHVNLVVISACRGRAIVLVLVLVLVLVFAFAFVLAFVSALLASHLISLHAYTISYTTSLLHANDCSEIILHACDCS
jgi:hypothetical protein